MAAEQRRRRIDRASDPDLSGRAESLELTELRTLRDECRQEELAVSYARRLLQARLDIARAEMARRAGEPGASENLVASLPSILADPESAQHRDARSVPLYHPAEEAGRRMADALLSDATLVRLPDLSDADLERLIEDFAAFERQTSELRAAVLRNLDALQVELVRRYREGKVPLDEVVEASAQMMRHDDGVE